MINKSRVINKPKVLIKTIRQQCTVDEYPKQRDWNFRKESKGNIQSKDSVTKMKNAFMGSSVDWPLLRTKSVSLNSGQ